MDNQDKNQPQATPETDAADTQMNQSEQKTDQSAKPGVLIGAPNTLPKKTITKPTLLVVALIITAIVTSIGGYMLGSSGKSNSISTNGSGSTNNDMSRDIAAVNVEVPQGATQLSECAKGRGAQFALPEDIPTGPVYNVHEGEVIGIEFMVGQDDLLSEGGKDFLNLPLKGAMYDHVNIGLLSQGHAGFPEPHYHVDIMMVPTSVTELITCE